MDIIGRSYMLINSGVRGLNIFFINRMMTLQTIFEVFITRAEDLTFTGSVNFLSDAFLS